MPLNCLYLATYGENLPIWRHRRRWMIGLVSREVGSPTILVTLVTRPPMDAPSLVVDNGAGINGSHSPELIRSSNQTRSSPGSHLGFTEESPPVTKRLL